MIRPVVLAACLSESATKHQMSAPVSISLSLLWSADILREFNPSLTGFSLGVGKQDSSEAFLNQAVAGAKSGSVPSHSNHDRIKLNKT